MPRKASLREHRNDHQLTTTKKLQNLNLVNVAWNENELAERLDRLTELQVGPEIPPYASEDLLDAVRDFLSS